MKNKKEKSEKYINIREYSSEFDEDLLVIFRNAVNSVSNQFYTQRQKELWASSSKDLAKWKARFANNKPFIAFYQNKPVGFMDIDQNGYIDLAYVSPKFQGLGVASKLLETILKKVKNSEIKSLTTNSSKAALSFFKKFGFKIVKKNEIKIEDEILENYSLKLDLK